MADLSRARPCIHVCIVGTAPGDLDRWVEVGAEEEGIPTRSIVVEENDAVAAAYAAAQSSRIDVGVAISADQVVLHEVHMPLGQPVLAEKLGVDPRTVCRRMGGNAARLVARLPFRFADEAAGMMDGTPESKQFSTPADAVPDRLPSESRKLAPEEDDVKRIIEIVAAIVRERGMQ